MSGFEVDTARLEKLLLNEGYKLVSHRQPWRHLVGEVEKEGKTYFVKASADKEIRERTKNEFAWNERVRGMNLGPLNVPEVYGSGESEGIFWFVGEFIRGVPMASVKSTDSTYLEKYLDKAVEGALAIAKIETLLPKDKHHLREYWQERIFSATDDWIKRADGKGIMAQNLIKNRLGELEIASIHGDYTPWHMLVTSDERIFLIDSEAAQMGGLAHYDAAYFFHRVYTKFKRPDIALRFLRRYVELGKLTDKEKRVLEAMIAQRLIGGYFDAVNDEVTSLELNTKLEEKLVAQDLF